MEIKNAQIKKVDLYIEDHDILTFSISLDLGGAYCCLGGYSLDQSFRDVGEDGWYDERLSTPAGLDCMRRIMEVVGVYHWKDLEGQYIRYEDNGWGSSVTKIGHIMKDEWIDIKEFFNDYSIEHWIKQYRSTCKKED